MSEEIQRNIEQDTALGSMVLLLSFLDRPADADQLRHLLGEGSERATADDLVRLARKLDVRGRKVAVGRRRLEDMPFPAIAAPRDGTHVVLLLVSAEMALLFHAHKERPRTVSRQGFEAQFSGDG